ncbi:hybrid sensor histidine kinase/response regulator transcription factor [Robertkochia solimangrovi]|uniref:hybrid sensor histidine kinase/response regulator transcription factor n=1 Tax=Robertkochia solimangrovi TaxID=2213046 RepID=UPI00117C1F82|nr:two-component regulator propeller domain-containing protein [Robertkochia solimangrovi]TRZ44286.1 hypothetical protein DMZ48_07155 [Robertkochia solimangrovi]
MDRLSKISCVLYLLLGLTSLICRSQSDVQFRHLNQTDGLSYGRVTSIVRELDGFLWIGTKNGLNRYDGTEIRIYNKTNSAIQSNDISDLLIDSRQRLWVTTLGGGLHRYDETLDDFISYKHNFKTADALPSNQINTLIEDHDGLLWLGTENGLSRFNPEKEEFRNFFYMKGSQNTLSHNSIMALTTDESGQIWIGTFGGGLNRFDPDTEIFEKIIPESEVFIDFIHCLTFLNSNELLVGCRGSGLVAYNLKEQKFHQLKTDNDNLFMEGDIIRAIQKDATNRIWIGSDGAGLFRLSPGPDDIYEVENFQHSPQQSSSISGNGIYDIYVDEDGTIWIGTAWSGINFLNSNLKYDFYYSDFKGDNPSPVLSIYKEQGRLFLGLDGEGLSVYDSLNKNIRRFNSELTQGFKGDFIQCITKTSKGTYLLGTYTNGFLECNFETNKFISIQHEPGNPQSLSYNDVRSIIEDRSGNLWLGTWGGGLNFKNGQTGDFSNYRANPANPNAISSDNVIGILKDSTGLWVATFGGGLNRFDFKDQNFSAFRNIEGDSLSIASNNILSIYKDKKGKIWIGTSGEGINRFDPVKKSFERFSGETALRYATVTAITQDNAGKIWFSTKKGIFSYDHEHNTFNNYPYLQDEYHINSVFKDPSGNLYFGGSKGAIGFDPAKLKYHETQKPVLLTDFKLFNRSVPIAKDGILTTSVSNTKEIVLEHDMNVISFDFTALSFPVSSNMEYAIKLENFDPNWRNIGNNRTATYTNLSPGTYTFKVKSREKGSLWSEGYTQVDLKVKYPVWLRWWAVLSYVLLAVLLLYLFRKYTIAWERMKSNLLLEKMTHEKDNELSLQKQQFFTNVSHEIRTPVTLILNSVNRILESSKGKLKNTDPSTLILKKNSEHLLQLVNELLDFRKLENLSSPIKVSRNDLIELCKEIYWSFNELADKKEIEFYFEQDTDTLFLFYDTKQLERVIYNLLSNALKFTRAGGKVTVKVKEDSEHAYIIVEDTGMGMNKEQLDRIFDRFYQTENADKIKETGSGLGLSISKEILKWHQAGIQVTSEPGCGSIFTVTLRKGKDHFNQELMYLESTGEKPYNLVDITGFDLQDPDLSDLKDQTILLVEDNQSIRFYLKQLLEPHCHILEAENGKEGLEKTLTFMPDLVISDIMMPLMDGLAYTKALKSDMRISHIPVILLTARSSVNHQAEAFETGADAFITKPFNEIILQARIKNIIHNRKEIRKKFAAASGIIDSLTINNSDQQFLENLTKIITNHLDTEELSATFIANEMGMSHSVIYKKIKSLTGMTLVEYLRDFKLKAARELIEVKGMNVSEACFRTGYTDRKYFSKQFKKKFGKNPSEYMQQH